MRVRGVVVVVALVFACAAPAAAQSPYISPGISPPGANDWTCKPSSAHPYPVVLVHGTFGDMTVSWNLISPRLKQDGYCVFALDYGHRGTDPIEGSAAQLRDFVDRVLAATGARKVSMVGHSQGGMMPRYYLKFLGGAGKVDELIGLSPSNHGTSNPGALLLDGANLCDACGQQATGSAFITNLNAGDETPGNVSYTVVQTRYDEVVIPYTSAFLSGANTTNVLLQTRCPLDVSEHLTIIYDAIALRWVRNALGRPGPADPNFRPSCLPL
jgi:triacylglycerol esterase/lipase EstA (alpha/beta hydrolase family)